MLEAMDVEWIASDQLQHICEKGGHNLLSVP